MSFCAVQASEFGGPEVLKVVSVDEPELQQDEVLVTMKAAGVNPVDTYIRSGSYVRKPQLPYTPGADGAGIVEKVGSKVSTWKVGDRVYLAGSVSGTYAEKAICKGSQLHLLPKNVSFDEGAAIYTPYATAYAALFHRANAKPGETILVHGASGGVGLAAVQIAVSQGMRVLGTASSKEGLEAIRNNGGESFNHREEGYEQEILDATDNKGANVILEMLSNVNLERDISKLIAFRGRVVIIGCRGTIEINPRAMMGKMSTVMGIALAHSTPTEFEEIFAYVHSGLSNGTLRPVISSFSFTMDGAPEAHKHIIDRPSGTIGKVVIRP